MKLRYLKINTLLDAAYQCGMDRQPIYLFIAAPPGTGKTWGSKSLKEYRGVTYFNSSYSPNEYKKHVKQVAESTVLFIHDDVGRPAHWNMKEFISAWCDMIDGHVDCRHFKSSICAICGFSVVLISTLDWYYAWKDAMRESGLIDRVLPITVGLSEETKENYRLEAQISAESNLLSDEPEQRKIGLRERHESHTLFEQNIPPRYLKNLLKISRYLTEKEMNELINIVLKDGVKYEI